MKLQPMFHVKHRLQESAASQRTQNLIVQLLGGSQTQGLARASGFRVIGATFADSGAHGLTSFGLQSHRRDLRRLRRARPHKLRASESQARPSQTQARTASQASSFRVIGATFADSGAHGLTSFGLQSLRRDLRRLRRARPHKRGLCASPWSGRGFKNGEDLR